MPIHRQMWNSHVSKQRAAGPWLMRGLHAGDSTHSPRTRVHTHSPPVLTSRRAGYPWRSGGGRLGCRRGFHQVELRSVMSAGRGTCVGTSCQPHLTSPRSLDMESPNGSQVSRETRVCGSVLPEHSRTLRSTLITTPEGGRSLCPVALGVNETIRLLTTPTRGFPRALMPPLMCPRLTAELRARHCTDDTGSVSRALSTLDFTLQKSIYVQRKVVTHNWVESQLTDCIYSMISLSVK